MWCLGTEPGSHAKIASTLNSQAYVNTIYFVIPFLNSFRHIVASSHCPCTKHWEIYTYGVCVDGTMDKCLAIQAWGPELRIPA